MANPQRRSFFAAVGLVTAILALLAFTLVMAVVVEPPVDEAGAAEAVRRIGYVDATVVQRFGGQSVAWQQGCGEGETSAVAMRATGADELPHELLVCCGGAARRTCNVRSR